MSVISDYIDLQNKIITNPAVANAKVQIFGEAVDSITFEDFEMSWKAYESNEASNYTEVTTTINSYTSDRYPIVGIGIQPDVSYAGGYSNSNLANWTITQAERTFTGNFSNLPIGMSTQVSGFAIEVFSTVSKTNELTLNAPLFVYDYNAIESNIIEELISEYSTDGDSSIFDEYVENETIIFVNKAADVEPESEEFTIYNTAQQGTWTTEGVSNVSDPYYRWVKIKLSTSTQADGRFAFYRKGLEDGKIKLVPKFTASIVACEYSTDGGANWQTSETFPFDYIYGSRIDELGTFIYATREGVNSKSSVPIFETEEEAEDWVNHSDDVDISDAINYEEVAERYGITNKTGTDISSTEFGTASNFRSHFTQQYILDRSEVSIVAEALYDTGTGGFWEQIKEGIDMFGENPINSVCGLIYYPIDLTTVFTRVTPQTYIYFGGYMFPPTGSSTSLSVYKLNGYDGYIDIGTFTIEPAFQQNDYRNWEPYCSLTLYLPFIGMQKVSYNKYLNKTIKIRYYIDITNGSCLCILMADNKMMDYFNGSIGIQIPITLTDFSGYAQAQIRNLSNMAGVGSNIADSALSGASGDVGGAISSGASAIGGFEKSMFAVSTTNINQFNTTKGSSGPMGNQYLPQKVYAIFEYVKTETTENLNQLEGTPSNASGNLGSFAGYLEADSIMLRTSAGMSEAEKAEFINLVRSGIYI